MKFSVEFVEKRTAPDADARDYRFRICSLPSGESLGLRNIRVAGRTQLVFDSQELEFAVFAFAVRRFEALGGDIVNDEYQIILADEDSLKAEGKRSKSCEFQARKGRDLHCQATSRFPAPAGLTEYNKSAITTFTCVECDLPDARIRCSHLVHIEKLISFRSPPRVSPTIALCEKGHISKIEKNGAKMCHGGQAGHRCWERIFDIHDDLETTSTPAWALADAVDHFAATWRLLFQSKLLQIGQLGPVAQLSESAISKTDFEMRLTALADLLKEFRIDAERQFDGTPPSHTLVHLEHALSTRVPSEAHAITAAIATLRAANGLRNSIQHAAAAAKAPVLASKLGISEWPPLDYGAAWESARTQVTLAFRRLRVAASSALD